MVSSFEVWPRLQQQQLATFATFLSSNYNRSKHLIILSPITGLLPASLPPSRTLVEQHLCNACVGLCKPPYPTSCPHHQPTLPYPLTVRSTAYFGLLQLCDEALPLLACPLNSSVLNIARRRMATFAPTCRIVQCTLL